MKRIFALLLTLICFSAAFSQTTYPNRLPNPLSDSGFYSIGYIRSTVLGFVSVGDTAIRPKYAGAQRVWQQVSDTATWLWTGQRWVKTGASNPGTVTDVYARLGLFIDTFVVVQNGVAIDWYYNPAAQGVLSGLDVSATGNPREYTVTPGVFRIGRTVYILPDDAQTTIPVECADTTLCRIDYFVVDTNLNFVVLPGTCAQPALPPSIDEQSEVYLSFVLQCHNSVTPPPPSPSLDWHETGNVVGQTGKFVGTIDNFDLNFKRGATNGGGIGVSNTWLGLLSLNNITSGTYNAAFGYGSLITNSSGSSNTGNGAFSIQSNTTGSNNTGVGYASLQSNTTGSNNTGIGKEANRNNTTGNFNTMIGAETYNLTAGDYKVGIGFDAFQTMGTQSVGIGSFTGLNSINTNAVFIGQAAGVHQSVHTQSYGTGAGNTAIGYSAFSSRHLNSSYNVILGYEAMRGAFGNDYDTSLASFVNNYCIALGWHAMFQQGHGDNNMAFGKDTQLPDTAGSNQINFGNYFYKSVNSSGALGTPTFDNSALFAFNSTAKGLLIPRMSSSQRIAIGSPALGLMVFDVTLQCLYFYDGGSWVGLCGGSSGDFIPLAGTDVGAPVTGDIEVNQSVGLKYYSSSLVGYAKVNFWEDPVEHNAFFGYTQDVDTTAITDGGMFISINGHRTSIRSGGGALALQSETDQNVNINALGGNVGIGTASPAGRLHVEADGNDIIFNGVSNFTSSSDQFNATLNEFHLINAFTTPNTVLNIFRNGQFSLNGDVNDDGSVTDNTIRLTEDGGLLTKSTNAANSAYVQRLKITGQADIAVASFSNSDVGIGTTSPTTQLHTTGTVRFANFGAGAATFDASGNISSVSDERLKRVQGFYMAGLKEIKNINPIIYKWNKKSGMEQDSTYAGFSAQNVKANIPYGTGTTKDGYLSLQDRALLAASVNAIKELAARVEKLEKENVKLKKLLKQF